MKTNDIRRFRGTLRRFTRLLDAQLKTCCARVTLAQCLVLLEVEEVERPTVGLLATNLRLDNSTLSRTLDGLEKRGLVERQRDDRDRRVVTLRLTPAGAVECRAIHAENDAICRDVFTRIPAAEHDTVVRSFEVLVQAYLDSEEEAPAESRCAMPDSTRASNDD